MMQPSNVCLELLKRFETLRLFAYPDPYSALARATPELRRQWGFTPARTLLAQVGGRANLSGAPWTIGYGETHGVTPDSTITADAALTTLIASMNEACRAMLSVVTVPLTQGMVDGLTSLVFNEGLGAEGVKDGFAVLESGRQSSILRKLNASDYLGARKEILVWIYAGGVRSNGLANRRQAEYAVYGDALPVAA